MGTGKVGLGIWACVVLVCSGGCVDFDPTGVPSVPDPLGDRIDSRSGGDFNFYFLPPLVRRMVYPGVFERQALEDLTVLLTMPGMNQPLSLEVVQNLNQEFYEARWDSPSDAASANLVVWLADKQLGSLDLEPALTADEARAVRGVDSGPFTPGRRVQIRFRVEVGAGEGDFGDGPRMWDGRNPGGDHRLLFTPPVARDRLRTTPFDADAWNDLVVEIWSYRGGLPQELIRRYEAESAVATEVGFSETGTRSSIRPSGQPTA